MQVSRMISKLNPTIAKMTVSLLHNERGTVVTFSRAQKQLRLSLSGMFDKELLVVCNVKKRAKIGIVEECITLKVW